MLANNDRLQKAQEQQAARQEDLQKGRIRIERPKDEETTDEREPQRASA